MGVAPVEYDYVVLGAGASGAVVAARLAEDPAAEVCLMEAGPSDQGDRRVLELRNWPNLLGSELDYDYRIEPQMRGNGRIRQSRGRILGGSSSHNSAIAFRAPRCDMEAWERSGAIGWGPEGTTGYFDRVLERVHLETAPDSNACAAAFVKAGTEAGFPFAAFHKSELREAVGWFQLAKRGPIRESSSVAYLHPLAKLPPNLTVLTGLVALRIALNENGRAVGVHTKEDRIGAREEIIVCCGAFDSPKLLLLSGIGPADHLRKVGIDVKLDLPGVGENLMDHAEGIMIWEAAKPVPDVTTQFWEAGLFACSDPGLEWPDLMFHFGTVAFDLNTAPLGYPTSSNAFSMTPNVARPRSRGWVRLRSSTPAAPPVIDMRYFTDPAGHDERVLLAGMKLARKIADQPSLKSWIRRELAPGSAITDDAVLSEYARGTSNTVYHPAGTCRMGRSDDSSAVVDPALRVRGLDGLRVADASIFPEMIGVNPCLTCMMIGEKCARLLRGG